MRYLLLHCFCFFYSYLFAKNDSVVQTKIASGHHTSFNRTKTCYKFRRAEKPVIAITGNLASDNGSAANFVKIFPFTTTATLPGEHRHTIGTEAFAERVASLPKEK